MNDLEIPKNLILHLLYIPSKKTKGGFVHSLSFVRPPPRLNPDRFNPRVTCELSPHVDRIACPHANSWCNTEPDRSKKIRIGQVQRRQLGLEKIRIGYK